VVFDKVTFSYPSTVLMLDDDSSLEVVVFVSALVVASTKNLGVSVLNTLFMMMFLS
jgi:hypothetical protein